MLAHGIRQFLKGFLVENLSGLVPVRSDLFDREFRRALGRGGIVLEQRVQSFSEASDFLCHQISSFLLFWITSWDRLSYAWAPLEDGS